MTRGPRNRPDATTVLPPELAARYRERELLGSGFSGKVVLAEDLRLGREVVVKLLAPIREHASLRERFYREAKFLSRVRDDRVVGLLDFGEAGGTPYLVEPFEPGRPLDETMKRGRPYPPERARVVLADLLGGLGAIHDAGLVHRDIKPQNALVTAEGRLKILDLGLASDLDATQGLTATGTFVGSLAYAAPGQLRGLGPDPRDDLFAVGVLAYELFSGVHPFRVHAAEGPGDVAARILERDPEPLGRRVPHLPAAVAAWVARLMEKRREDRFGDAAAAAAAFAAAWDPGAAGGPVWSAAAGHPAPAPSRGVRRLGATATVAAVALGTWIGLGSGPEPAAPAAGPPGGEAADPVARPAPAGPRASARAREILRRFEEAKAWVKDDQGALVTDRAAVAGGALRPFLDGDPQAAATFFHEVPELTDGWTYSPGFPPQSVEDRARLEGVDKSFQAEQLPPAFGPFAARPRGTWLADATAHRERAAALFEDAEARFLARPKMIRMPHRVFVVGAFEDLGAALSEAQRTHQSRLSSWRLVRPVAAPLRRAVYGYFQALLAEEPGAEAQLRSWRGWFDRVKGVVRIGLPSRDLLPPTDRIHRGSSGLKLFWYFLVARVSEFTPGELRRAQGYLESAARAPSSELRASARDELQDYLRRRKARGVGPGFWRDCYRIWRQFFRDADWLEPQSEARALTTILRVLARPENVRGYWPPDEFLELVRRCRELAPVARSRRVELIEHTLEAFPEVPPPPEEVVRILRERREGAF